MGVDEKSQVMESRRKSTLYNYDKNPRDSKIVSTFLSFRKRCRCV